MRFSGLGERRKKATKASGAAAAGLSAAALVVGQRVRAVARARRVERRAILRADFGEQRRYGVGRAISGGSACC